MLHKVWSDWLCRIFRNYRVTCMTARKKCIWYVRCLLSLQLVSETLLIPGRIPRDIITSTVFMDSVVGKENRYRVECSVFKPWRRHNFPHLSGTAPPPARWITGLLPGVEWPTHSVDHPLHLAPSLMKGQSCTSPHPRAFMVRYRVNFTFT
jgi:hypothetical protein